MATTSAGVSALFTGKPKKMQEYKMNRPLPKRGSRTQTNRKKKKKGYKK